MSQRIYLLDTSVILPLVRGNALGQNHPDGARNMDGEVIDLAVTSPQPDE